MPVFMMFGKYTRDSLRQASAERTREAIKVIEKYDGKVISMYALLGENDLVITLDFPDTEKALAASMTLNKLTGIRFTTTPVVEVEKFDHLLDRIEKL
jgi:uncharacterized protein with GYD domain